MASYTLYTPMLTSQFPNPERPAVYGIDPLVHTSLDGDASALHLYIITISNPLISHNFCRNCQMRASYLPSCPFLPSPTKPVDTHTNIRLLLSFLALRRILTTAPAILHSLRRSFLGLRTEVNQQVRTGWAASGADVYPCLVLGTLYVR